ncbi:MAG: hypothetical protein WD960_01620 [Gemmatimonadota bacterium]
MMFQHFFRSKSLLSGAVAGLVAVALTGPTEAEADEGIKQEVCSFLGCNEGDLDCAEVDVNIDGDVWVIEAGGSVTFFCREDGEGGPPPPPGG